MSRTTLDIDQSVLRQLRQRGKDEHKSMGQVASELLAFALAKTEHKTGTTPLNWISKDLGTPLVDLDDKEAVRATLDQRS